MFRLSIASIFILLFLPLSAASSNGVKYISPLDYGLTEAISGVERYLALERCHKDAVTKNAAISYAGIKTLDIEIPANAKSIPLPDEVDFAGVQINVLNKQKNIFLFTKAESLLPVQVSKQSIDYGQFDGDDTLCHGRKLLIIEDGNPWVANRRGYSYGATRRDIIVIENGMAENSVTYQYDNGSSIPKASIAISGSPKAYKNLIFNRDVKSTKITYLFAINGLFDVTVSDIVISTPQDNDLYGDAAIQILNSAKVRLSDVAVHGTYSQTDRFGYGIKLDNVAMFTGERIYARARWGVFGTNNVNGVILRDCDINRFDIHCYGKNVSCFNCRFSDLYNQFSSVFGDVYFEKCTFTNFIPVLMESSYNAYTPFDLTFKNCTFNLTANRNYLVTLSGLEETHNSRPELSCKALPNITIKNCAVNLADDVKEWYIINTGKVSYKEPLDYINKIEVNRLKIIGSVDYKVFSSKLKTSEPLKLVRKGVKINKRLVNTD